MNLLADERIHGIVLTARDIDARRAFEEQLRHRAFHDPLTRSRTARCSTTASSARSRARRRRTTGRGALWTWTLQAGERRLGDAVATNCSWSRRPPRDGLRSSDTVARLGGDEFGVLLEQVAGPERGDSGRRADHRPGSTNRSWCMARWCPSSLSVGIARHRRPRDTGAGVDEMLRKADLAMYAAKRGGKRRWELYDRDLERLAQPGYGTGRARTS